VFRERRLEIFEYVSVLTSIIIGLGLAYLLAGIARLIQHPGRFPVYWVHLVWVAYVFFFMSFWWWWQFKLDTLAVWYFQNYLFLLIYAVVLYMICALLSPSDLSEYRSYEEYFFSRRRWFFGLLAATYVLDVYDTWLKGAEHFHSLGPQYPLQIGVYISLAIAAILTANRKFHGLLAVVALSYNIYWAFLFWGTQG